VPVLYAFSVHHFISSVGADAGFAAIIGLAVLVLLYFAQARETATLRENSHEAAQRIMQLEGRLMQLGRQTAAPVAPSPVPSPLTGAAQRRPAAVAVAPFAPAGVAAPALSAATRLIPADPPMPAPMPAPAPTPAPPAEVPVPAQQPAVPEPIRVPEHAAAPAARRIPSATPAPVGAAPLPRPATAAAGANGSGGYGSVPRPAVRGATGTAPPRVQMDPGGAPRRQPLLSPSDYGPERHSRSGRAFAALLTVLIVGAAVAVLLIVTSGGSKPTQTVPPRTTNAPGSHPPATTAFKPSTVTVTVLNGTGTAGLAHQVAQRLAAVGYKQGAPPTNAAEQTHTATVVAYMPGAANRRDAEQVASSLKLSANSVQPIDQGTQQIACAQSQPCTANVVVTVGADLEPGQ
jgi:hypothetical protein